MKLIDGIPVWGEVLDNALAQMKNCLRTAKDGALMADHHLGYAVPVGGVVVYKDAISPSGVGFDIACGNKAVRLDIPSTEVRSKISTIMDDIARTLSFGIGRKNPEPVEHELFGDALWQDDPLLYELEELAASQLGTIGSGNHYVDLFQDEQERIWVGVHFGSRGLGHKIASYFIKEGGGKDGIDVDPCVLSLNSELGSRYFNAMELAGRYAYAGRDWVCSRVAKLLGAEIVDEVHNHHNFAWKETHNVVGDVIVVRKGATPAFPGQRGFVGSTMAESSVILEGVDSFESAMAYYSTVHGAGRVMSRTQAAGKTRFRHGKRTRISEGEISRGMMMEKVRSAGVELRGAGVDESPHCYKRLNDVLNYHDQTIKILHRLRPLGVVMAGADEFDPYKD